MAYAEAWITGQQLYHMATGGFGESTNFDISLPETLKYFAMSTSFIPNSAELNLHRKNPGGSVMYSLYVEITANSSTGKFNIVRYCENNASYCKAISNGATCSHSGGDGDVPWCYK